jgi:4a-hydroxytetrahydrobiopterin dehydratase
MITAADLLSKNCAPQTVALNELEIAAHLRALEGWALRDGAIEKTFALRDFHQVMDFINEVAAIVHKEDHHPDMTISYNRCRIRFNTHSVNQGKGAISVNDFICAAKIDALRAARFASQ